MNIRSIGLIVMSILIVIVGVEVYLFFKASSNSPQIAPTAAPVSLNEAVDNSSDIPTPPLGSVTFQELLSKNKNQKCTYSEGTIEISGNKIRIDDSVSHNVVENSIVYSWYDGKSIGEKANFDLNGVIVNSEDKTTFSCQEATPDAKLFEIPTNINFMDATNK